MSLTILLADDHALMRSGLRLVLGQIDPTFTVIEAADGRAAVEAARKSLPQVCLLDISMPGLNGIDAIPQVLQSSPHTRVIVITMHAERQYVNEALRAGAQGYLLKDSAVDELAEAITAVRQGRPFLSRKLSDSLLTDYLRGTATEGSPRASVDAQLLTPRQREVLQRIAEGSSTREIAEALHLSVKTVETHRAEIMRRLDIHDVAGLTRYAIRHGFVDLGSL